MLSGASLSYTAKENFSLAKYYKKRFLRILIPFYILYIVYFLFLLFQSHSVHNIFPEGIPAWRIVFTFLGMDSWVSMHLFPYHRRMVSGMSYSVVSDLSIASIFYDKK